MGVVLWAESCDAGWASVPAPESSTQSDAPPSSPLPPRVISSLWCVLKPFPVTRQLLKARLPRLQLRQWRSHLREPVTLSRWGTVYLL